MVPGPLARAGVGVGQAGLRPSHNHCGPRPSPLCPPPADLMVAILMTAAPLLIMAIHEKVAGPTPTAALTRLP